MTGGADRTVSLVIPSPSAARSCARNLALPASAALSFSPARFLPSVEMTGWGHCPHHTACHSEPSRSEGPCEESSRRPPTRCLALASQDFSPSVEMTGRCRILQRCTGIRRATYPKLATRSAIACFGQMHFPCTVAGRSLTCALMSSGLPSMTFGICEM